MELERRGVPMDHEAWSAPASLEYAAVLEAVHLDYIRAGSQIVTANTFSSSRPMLETAGYGERVEEVNRLAVESAQKARDASGIDEIAVAGSMSHWTKGHGGRERASDQKLADIFGEQASILKTSGAEVILLKMMYVPQRIEIVLNAAVETGLPVWLGFSARHSSGGEVVSFQSA